MDLKKAFPLIIAVACGILALILLNSYISSKELEIKKNLEYQIKQNQSARGASLKDTGIVLIAKKTISPQTLITAADISIQQLPKEKINPTAAISLEDVLGYAPNRAISKGKQILKTNLSRLKIKKTHISVPEGKKVIPVLIDNFSSISTIVQPANYVDVFITLPPSTKMPILEETQNDGVTQNTLLLFQNIKVFAVGEKNISKDDNYTRNKQISNSAKNQTVSLILNPEEIKVLSFVQSQNGKITLALRALGEKNENSLEPIDWDFLFKYLKKTPRTTIEIYRGPEKEIIPLIHKEAAE